ncbi:hypothetical protein V7147_17735 [Bacillus sp. JJ1521]
MSKKQNKTPADIEYSIWDTNTDKDHTTLPINSSESLGKKSRRKKDRN